MLSMLRTIMINSYNQLTTSRRVMMSMVMVLLLSPLLMNIKADQIIQGVQTTSTTTTQIEDETTTKSTKAHQTPVALAITKKENAENDVKTNNNHQTNIDDQKLVKANTGLDIDNVSVNDTLKAEDSNWVMGKDEEAANQKTFNFSVNNYVVVKPVIGLTNYSTNRLIKIKALYIAYRENLTASINIEDSGDKVDEQSVETSLSGEAITGDMNGFYNSDFERWNNKRLMDGLLCQNDSECHWLDHKLICKTDILLNFDANVRII